jgi:TRAP-type mannitol/chloroaromatic compound transport system substrate-binding protein
MFKKLLSVMCILTLVMMSIPAAAETITWKCQSMYGAGQPNYKNFVQFTEDVKVMSGGRLVIKPLSAKTIVPTFELLDAIQAGVLEAMHTGAVYYSGKEAGLALITDLIYAWTAPWESEGWFYYGGGKELLNEYYNKYGITAIGVVQWGFESFPAKFPINSMADYKGHKFRSPQGMTADTLGKLGAGVVILPGGEVYSALDKGVVEGTDWGTPSMNMALGFNQVCKYFVYPENRSAPMSEFSVRTEKWNALPDDLKRIVEVAVRKWNAHNLQTLGVLDAEAVNKWIAQGGVALNWTKEARDDMRTFVRKEIWPLWSGRSAFAKKVLTSQVNWMVKIGTVSQEEAAGMKKAGVID